MGRRPHIAPGPLACALYPHHNVIRIRVPALAFFSMSLRLPSSLCPCACLLLYVPLQPSTSRVLPANMPLCSRQLHLSGASCWSCLAGHATICACVYHGYGGVNGTFLVRRSLLSTSAHSSFVVRTHLLLQLRIHLLYTLAATGLVTGSAPHMGI
jgi:hypothetical protein